MNTPQIVSVREQPGMAPEAIRYIQSRWPQVPPILYEDCITHCLEAPGPLPQWYLLQLEGKSMGCCGLVPNDFISRMDLYPWICALYVDEAHRGHAYGALLLARSRQDCHRLGFAQVYLSTEHVGYYERYGFGYVGQGYAVDGAATRIYQCSTAL